MFSIRKIIVVIIVFLLAVLFWLFAYPRSTSVGPIISPAPSSPDTIVLPVGRTGQVGGLFVRFDSLVADNRCPIDVVCIEAGAVTAKVTLSYDESVESLNLPQDQVPHEFAGHRVSIVKAMPEARSTISIPSDEYVVEFRVTRD